MNPSNQIGLPTTVTAAEIARKKTLGAAIELCAEAAGFSLDKQLQEQIGADKAQFSRWLSGQEGILWHKFSRLMDVCGNDAPLLWMIHQRQYDITSLRKQESETERRLREKEEQLAAVQAENQLMRKLLGRP